MSSVPSAAHSWLACGTRLLNPGERLCLQAQLTYRSDSLGQRDTLPTFLAFEDVVPGAGAADTVVVLDEYSESQELASRDPLVEHVLAMKEFEDLVDQCSKWFDVIAERARLSTLHLHAFFMEYIASRQRLEAEYAAEQEQRRNDATRQRISRTRVFNRSVHIRPSAQLGRRAGN